MTRSESNSDVRPVSFLGILLANRGVLAPPVLRRLLAFTPPPVAEPEQLPLIEGAA